MGTPSDKLNFPGDFIMDFAFIVNHKGESIDVSASVVDMSLYESIDRPFVTGEFTLIDSDGLVKTNELNLGQELFILRIRTPTMPEETENVVDSGEIAFRIVNVKQDIISTNVRTLVYSFTTKEFVKDKQVRVSKSYTAAYSDMVLDVLNAKLKTDKSVIVEPTRATYKHTITDQHPMEFISTIQRKCHSLDRNNVGYLFYERLDNQFHFRSYGSLIANAKTADDEVRTYTLNKSGSRGGMSNQERLLNILKLTPMPHHNQIVNLNEGYYGSRLGAFDLYTKTYAETTYNHFAAYKNTPHLNYSDEGEPTDVMPHARTPDREGNTLADYPDYLQMNTIHTTADAETLTYPDRTILQERSQSLNWRQNRIQIEVYGASGIHAGEILRIVVPSINEDKSQLIPDVEPQLSGTYIIEAIQHRINMSPNKQHRMLFTCVRDSQEITLSIGENSNEAATTYRKEDITLTPSNKI